MTIRFSGIALSFILLAGIMQPLAARPPFLMLFQSDPFRNSAVDGCGTCHENPQGGGPRNEFGNAFDEAGFAITPMLRASFSDRFEFSTTELPDGSVFYFSDPESQYAVFEKEGRKRLVDLEAVIAGRAAVVEEAVTDREAESGRKPEALAEEWFTRLNALDDWYISFDGREENKSVVDHFIELYSPDAYHQIGPSEDQIGPVVLHGHESIRRWADEFSKNYVDLNYRVEYKTRKEKTLEPYYVIQFPWGGTGAAVEFHAVYTTRQERREFVVPGAVFFMFDEAGKIENLRLYLLRDELVELGV